MSLPLLVVGNWKMHGLRESRAELEAVMAGAPGEVRAMICPPATLVAAFAAAAGGGLEIGGQDCHANPSGAHTGDVSAEMLADAGAVAVIVGHSERRIDHGETDMVVAAKRAAAHRAGLLPILCVGETEAERDAGQAEPVVRRQLAAALGPAPNALAVAYEPVWAIGTGRVPELADIAAMHAAIRAELIRLWGSTGAEPPILYGGSVKPGNAAEIFATEGVGGALVGGASLRGADFLGILRAAAARA